MCLFSIGGLNSFKTDYMMSALRTYALEEWVNQLRHVCNCWNKVDQQEKQEIFTLLYQMLKSVNLEMFHTYSAPDPVVDFINHETLDLIISLFSDQECVSTTDDSDTQGWMRACVLEPAQVFVPLGREAASKWLIDSWRPDACMMMIWAVLNVLNGNSLDILDTIPSSDTVLTVARWAQLEENARWHHNVGACLSDLGHFDAAIEHLNAALGLEPTWSAKKDLAKLYWEQGKLENSVLLLRECEERCRELLVENDHYDNITDPGTAKIDGLGEIRKNLGLIYIQLGDYLHAMVWLKECIELWGFLHTSEALSALICLHASLDSRLPSRHK